MFLSFSFVFIGFGILLLPAGESFLNPSLSVHNGWTQRTLISRRGQALYGIPKLFRWLVDLYPMVVESVGKSSQQSLSSIDNFYLDMNGIIHACTHSNSDDLVLTSEKDMFIRIFAYTDRLYKLVRPKRLMFLAVDGVAPRAKMNQQRARRFKASKERESLIAEYVAVNGELPEDDSFDSNCITPGTEFMFKLSLAFQRWIEHKMKTDLFWKTGAEIVFSGPNVPGEGEHKVMDMVREMQASDPDYQLGQWRHCMYGLDADLIMLSLVTHEPFFVLLREKQHLRREKKTALQFSPNDFETLEISMLRKILQTHFKTLFRGVDNASDRYRLLLQMKDVEKRHVSGAESLLDDDKDLPSEISTTDINSAVTMAAAVKAKDVRRVVDDFVFMCFFIGNDFLPSIPHLDIANGALNVMMSTYQDMFPVLGGHLVDKESLHLPRIELFMQELSRRETLYFEQRAVDDKEPRYKGIGYKDFYYQTKFGLEPNDIAGRRKIVQSYIEGLAWVSTYYHRGCKSWTWFYPYLYAPLASDLVNLGDLKIHFPSGRMFTPLMQLLAVLPPQSSKFLPPAYADLMTHPLSPLSHFYPNEFEVDANGKHNSWESVVVIPFLDEEALVENVSLIDHASNLTESEKARNRVGTINRYAPLTTGTGSQRSSTPPTRKEWTQKRST